MEEQITQQPRPRGNKIVPLVIILVLLAVGLGAYFMLAGRCATTDPASYMPKDVAMAVTMDLTTTADKKAAEDYIRVIFKDAGTPDPEKELFDSIKEELNINVEKDIIPYINGTGGIAVLNEMGGMMPSVMAVIGARSKKDADALVTVISDSLKKNSVMVQKSKYEGVEYILATVGGDGMSGMQMINYVGAVNGSVVYTNSEVAFKKVVDTVKNKQSLSNNANYSKLIQKGDGVFATTYYSGENLYKLIGPMLMMAAGQAGPGAADNIREGMMENIAAVGTAEASGDGIKFTVNGITKSSGPGTKKVAIDQLAAGAPKNAAVVMSMGNLADVCAEYKKAIAKSPALKAQMDKAALQVKNSCGLDLYADIWDQLKSVYAYYIPKPQANSSAFPGEVSAIFQVDKPAAAATTLKKLHAVMAMTGGPNVKPLALTGQTIFTAPIDSNSTYGDAIIGDKVLIHAGSAGSIKQAVSDLKSGGDGIASTDGFKLVKKYIPAESGFLVYGDVGAIIRVFSKDMSAKDRKTTESITKKVGIFAMTADSSGNNYQIQTVIPFAK